MQKVRDMHGPVQQTMALVWDVLKQSTTRSRPQTSLSFRLIVVNDLRLLLGHHREGNDNIT